MVTLHEMVVLVGCMFYSRCSRGSLYYEEGSGSNRPKIDSVELVVRVW